MDYTNKVPPYDTQYCAATHSDVQDCTVESLAHVFFIITGVRVSPRAWAVACHLENPANRNVSHVLAVVNQVGYVLWEDCPTPDSFTLESYYQPLTLAEAKFHYCKIELLPFDLNTSPGWTEIVWGLNLPVPSRHMVAQINSSQYFDSEAGAPIKPLTYGNAQVVYQTSLKIIINQTTMLKFTKDENGQTCYLEGEKGKLGLADPAALALISQLTADQPEASNPATPQVGIIETGFNIHK